MIGQMTVDTLSVLPLEINHLEYAISAVALKAGPSRCGRPQGPVKAVLFTSNLGSPRLLPSVRSPDGFATACNIA